MNPTRRHYRISTRKGIDSNKIILRLQERLLSKKRGAEGANPDEIGTKLSGKRTVT